MFNDFYRNKSVLITGHTGFKGSWMCMLLSMLGAKVTGYSLEPPTNPSLFKIADIEKRIISVTGDVSNLKNLITVFNECRPEIVIHMAAQPLVRESYTDPVNTYLTNVMGTVNLLEAVRQYESVKSVINVTTDKVYFNNEWIWGYRENDVLDGYDPYSNSKSCSELVTGSYKRAFFQHLPIAVSTCRAGNVIGGGDFAKDRIIPDCVYAMKNGKDIIVRNPYSTRPYQHVLEPVCAYLLVAMYQYQDKAAFEGSYNVGPDDCDCVTTGDLADLFCSIWGEGCKWINKSEAKAVHEAGLLKLDCTKIKDVFSWTPRWHILDAVRKTVEWSKEYLGGGDVSTIMEKQIRDYLEEQVF